MNYNVHPSIHDLLVDISSLSPLDGNPRKGNVDAIMSSYKEFGQIKPIVIRPNDDGTSTVVAGNHQVQAAKKLGWTHIAAVKLDADDQKAIAFALADNRTNELGYSDSNLVFELLSEVQDSYTDLLDGLGWDEFEIAYYDEHATKSKYESIGSESQSGFVVPEISAPVVPSPDHFSAMVRQDEDGEHKIIAGNNADHEDAAIRGSTVVTPGAAPKAVVQYTIVFEDSEQQKRWYDFIRWLKLQTGYEGATVSQKLMAFIDAHSEV